jgi:regulatory protein
VEEAERDQERKPRGERKKPRKVSARYLENAALYYLKRYAATVAQLKRVLVRRVDRSIRVHGGERTEALKWVEKLARTGLINDSTYAGMKAHSLRASGRSSRVIAQKLKMKGVSAEVVQQKVAEATAEVSEDDAALIWARKKRLGPYRKDASTRKDNRQRDLAALARAGFSFGIAKKIIDSEPE